MPLIKEFILQWRRYTMGLSLEYSLILHQYQHQKQLSWCNSGKPYWRLCYLSSRGQDYLIECGKCLKPAINIRQYSPKDKYVWIWESRVEVIPTEGILYSFLLNLGLSGFGVHISQERNASTRKHNHGFIKWELQVYELVFYYCCNTNLVFLSNTNYCTVLSKSVDWKRILSRCFVTKNDLGKRKGCKPGQADTLSYMHNSDLHAKIKGCLYEGKRKLREGEVRPIELYYKYRILPIGSCDYVVWELLPWALALPTDTPNWCLF